MDSKRKISEDVSENTSSDQSQSRALTTPKKELLPEQKARVWIDRELEEAGWKVVDRSEYTPDLEAAAIREVLMTGNKEADYILMLGGKAVAVVEAKKSDIPLDDPHLIQQAEGYTTRLLKWFPAFEKPLKLVYVSNGKEIAFRDFHVPNSEYEQIETFHRPKDIVEKLNLPGYFDGLPYLSPKRLRDCQYHAIKNLEKSFKEGKEKALIVLATGAGKTFTACTICYRMLSFTKARRILFLVDRNNLGTGAKQEFQSFNLTQTGKNFSEIFAVEKLGRQKAEDKAEDAKSLKSKEKAGKVVISTIQRLYAQLTGQPEEVSEENEDSGMGHKEGEVVEVPKNAMLPPDYFDLIIIDECHRSIYSDWKKVLDYFSSARKIGMTATPIPETLAFFDKNQVANYTLEQSILDGVNVPGRILRIKTKIGENGGTVKKGEHVNSINVETKEVSNQTASEEKEYKKTDLNRSVVVRDQIRKVLQEYKDSVYTKMYPDREPNFDYLPKTLIFAESDIHASLIVEVAKEVFGREDDRFVQKITYSVDDCAERIQSFKRDVDFRIAVTVTLIATGTDVKPLEVLMFLSDVHSETLYTQMKGRGVRTISDEQLREVTPNAHGKELYYLIDAVGVTESEKHVASLSSGDGAGGGKTLNPTLKILLEWLSLGYVSDENLSLLAVKLLAIRKRCDPEDLVELYKVFPITLEDFAEKIMNALDSGKLPPFISPSNDNTERMDLVRVLLENKKARRILLGIARGFIKDLVDQKDEVISSGFSIEDAKKSTEAFESYVRLHKDDIEALRYIYNSEDGKLSHAVLQDLKSKLSAGLEGFGISRLWNDYALVQDDDTEVAKTTKEEITELIQLVRFAYGMIKRLVPLTSNYAQRFELWCGQKQRDLPMTPAQRELFKKIALYIAQNGGCSFKTLKEAIPDLATDLVRELGNAKAANEQIFSLNEFILKTA